MIGTALMDSLRGQGVQVLTLVRRRPTAPHEVQWSVDRGVSDISKLNGVDAIVHLAGSNIGSGPMGLPFWTNSVKDEILRSRQEGTLSLSRLAAALEPRPRVLVSASGVGFYGTVCDAHPCTEQSPQGDGFLSHVAQVWEESTQPAQEAGIRVVRARLGVVLSPRGGALAKLMLPFKLGLGGKVGSGSQYMSWITLPDAVSALEHLMSHEELSGPVNVTAPHPATNAEFTRALGAALWRPTLCPLPSPVVRLLFGEMGDETLLCSQRVVPTRLLDSGFRFAHPAIHGAVDAMVGRGASSSR